MRARAELLLVLMTTLGAVAGAGAPRPVPDEPASKTPAVDACAVLTRAEIEPTFGALKGAPERDTGLRVSLYGADRWGLEKGSTFSLKRGTDSVVYVKKGGGVLEISCSCDLAKAEALAAKAAPRI